MSSYVIRVMSETPVPSFTATTSEHLAELVGALCEEDALITLEVEQQDTDRFSRLLRVAEDLADALRAMNATGSYLLSVEGPGEHYTHVKAALTSALSLLVGVYASDVRDYALDADEPIQRAIEHTETARAHTLPSADWERELLSVRHTR